MMNRPLIGIYCIVLAAALQFCLLFTSAHAQTPINITKFSSDVRQAIRDNNTLQQMFKACALEPDGSSAQTACVSFLHDYDTHMQQLFSNHTSLINHLLGIGP